ncbi:SET domain-containing protein-lysine N-methyltransferase [Sediminibacterium soli]|uniref:SET domain-containing protein-lysine N-methyltransferase n=1 Tax=Sediminibacterium soli TaxID=2698829 RepID=UPI00137B8F34|nr:SET domain-containing protein-lysine N-methyltransferase [Sediminibacterium soli]NCI48253.1 SET domain-containing protein [Sediminibacterium soli]
MVPAITSAYLMVSKHGFADIMQNSSTGEKSLHASAFFDEGDVICDFEGQRMLDTPSYLTVQVGENRHILLHPEFLQYINHSCAPNVFFDTSAMQLIALKAIQPGDELLFFYPSTEWDMAQPFDCFCGTPQCLHRIQGAAHLRDEEIMQYRLTRFIQEKVQNRSAR